MEYPLPAGPYHGDCIGGWVYEVRPDWWALRDGDGRRLAYRGLDGSHGTLNDHGEVR